VALWRWLGAQLNCYLSLSSVASLFDCVPRQCSSQLRDVFVAAIIHTVHAIWLARNSIRFSAPKVSIYNTMIKISSMVTLSGINSSGNCLSSDIYILKNFLVSPSHRRVKEIVTVISKPPTINWIKANTDGSLSTPSPLVVGFSVTLEVLFWELLLVTSVRCLFLRRKSWES